MGNIPGTMPNELEGKFLYLYNNQFVKEFEDFFSKYPNAFGHKYNKLKSSHDQGWLSFYCKTQNRHQAISFKFKYEISNDSLTLTARLINDYDSNSPVTQDDYTLFQGPIDKFDPKKIGERIVEGVSLFKLDCH